MLIVELKNVKLYAHHGVTAEERVTGGWFELNVEVKFKENKEVITDVYDTVDYEQIFNIVKERMSVPSSLMETVAMEIAKRVKERYFVVKEVTVQILKLNPPIPGLEGQASVKCTRVF